MKSAASHPSKIDARTEIIKQLAVAFPGKNIIDLYGDGRHLVCEIEPSQDHPEYDRAIEVIIRSRPHKHLKTTQIYTVIKGSLNLHLGSKTIHLEEGEKQTVEPGIVHWAESDGNCWSELYSTPGWTAEDHVVVDISESVD